MENFWQKKSRNINHFNEKMTKIKQLIKLKYPSPTEVKRTQPLKNMNFLRQESFSIVFLHNISISMISLRIHVCLGCNSSRLGWPRISIGTSSSSKNFYCCWNTTESWLLKFINKSVFLPSSTHLHPSTTPSTSTRCNNFFRFRVYCNTKHVHTHAVVLTEQKQNRNNNYLYAQTIIIIGRVEKISQMRKRWWWWQCKKKIYFKGKKMKESKTQKKTTKQNRPVTVLPKIIFYSQCSRLASTKKPNSQYIHFWVLPSQR